MTVMRSDNPMRDLRTRWEAHRLLHPHTYRYDVAKAIDASEAELVALDCGTTATRLAGDWREVLKTFHRLGRVMCLTRNEHAVHERKGFFRPVSFNEQVGLVLDEGIDLRLFMSRWAHGFAVINPDGKTYKRSFQFFDETGDPVHKVFVSDAESETFDSIAEAFTARDQTPELEVQARREPVSPRTDDAVDVELLRESWGSLKDTHDFHPMLRRLEVARTQACRLVGGQYAERLSKEAHRDLFRRASERALPIMVFVGNAGCIQIHTGAVTRLMEARGWFNILDPDFNLHLKESGVAEVWLTRKPTVDGVVTGVELFDAAGREIALIFGKRKPGLPELEAWRELAESLPRL